MFLVCMLYFSINMYGYLNLSYEKFYNFNEGY